MIKTKNKNLIFVIFFVNILIYNHVSFAKIEFEKNILSQEDTKIYKQIFELQRLPIKSKNSKVWKKVDVLIKKIENKILLGNVYADRYLHPTGWRSSYSDLKKWLDKYNDHPDATRITRIALKRKPSKLKSPKKPTPGF